MQGTTYLGNCVLNDLLVRHIALVAYEELVDALGGVAVDLLQPLLDVVEAVHIGHIVDDADAVGTAVVGRGDGAEPFLAGGIPLSRSTICQWSEPRVCACIATAREDAAYDLELHRLAIELDCSDFLPRQRKVSGDPDPIQVSGDVVQSRRR